MQSLRTQVNLYKHEHDNIVVGSSIPVQDQLSLFWQQRQGWQGVGAQGLGKTAPQCGMGAALLPGQSAPGSPPTQRTPHLLPHHSLACQDHTNSHDALYTLTARFCFEQEQTGKKGGGGGGGGAEADAAIILCMQVDSQWNAASNTMSERWMRLNGLCSEVSFAARS